MRKWITLLMTCLVAGSISYANANVGQVDVEAGYRRDNISWKLRFPSNDPFLRTTNRFENLDIFQLGINGRTTLGCNLYLRANAYWGWILDGDYKRRIATSFEQAGSYEDGFNIGTNDRIRTTVDDKYVYGVNAAIGYPFYFCDCTTVVAPVIGYGFDEQSVQFDHGGFNFGNDYGNSGENCCRQTFNSRWYGPFAGIDFNYRPYGDCWNFYADFEYHWGDFRGRRSGDDGANFFDRGYRHSRNATGWVFAAGAEYDLCNCWTVGLSVKFQDWQANRHHRICDNNGDQEFFGCDGYNNDGYCADRQRTNHRWRSYAINVTVGREF